MGQMNRSVLRAISLLKVFQGEDEWVSASEISRRAALPFASTYRLLQTLEQTGAVDKGDGGSYRLGYLIASLSQNVNVDDCLNRASRDLISGLAQELHVSILLGRLEGKMITLIARAFAPGCKYKFAAGSRFGAYSFALGRVLLADLPIEEMDRLIKDETAGALSVQAAARKSELIAELAQIRKQGYAVERDVTYPGLGSVAVPLRDNDGHVFAALSASDETRYLTVDRVALLRNELLALEPMLRKRILPDSSAGRTRAVCGSAPTLRDTGLKNRVPLPQARAQELLLKRAASN